MPDGMNGLQLELLLPLLLSVTICDTIKIKI